MKREHFASERVHFAPEQPLLQGCDGTEWMSFGADQYLAAPAEWSWERSSTLLLHGSGSGVERIEAVLERSSILLLRSLTVPLRS